MYNKLVSSFNLSQSFNYALYIFCQKTVQIRDQLFLYTDPKHYWSELLLCLVSGLRRVGGRLLRPGLRRLLRHCADRMRIHPHRQRDLHHRPRIQQQQQSGQPSLPSLFLFLVSKCPNVFWTLSTLSYHIMWTSTHRCQCFLPLVCPSKLVSIRNNRNWNRN